MSILKRFVAAGFIVACGSLAHAQTTGTGTGTTGGGGMTTGGGGQASPQSAIQEIQIETPTITSTTEGGVQRSNALATSNALGGFYANPLYQGRAGAQTGGLTAVNPAGGFGVALYGTTGISGAAGAGGTGGARGTGANAALGGTGGAGAAGRTGGATALGGTTGGRGGVGGTTGGLGGTAGGFGGAGRGGAGGFGATGLNNQNAALSTGRQIAYTQTLRIPGVAPIAPVQLQSDLQTMLNSTTAISNVGGVQVMTGDGGVVLIRGQVSDEDEVRLVEGMIRLTPGVKEVKNELTTK